MGKSFLESATLCRKQESVKTPYLFKNNRELKLMNSKQQKTNENNLKLISKIDELKNIFGKSGFDPVDTRCL